MSTRLPLQENWAPATWTKLLTEVTRLLSWSLILTKGICFTVLLNSIISWAKSVCPGGGGQGSRFSTCLGAVRSWWACRAIQGGCHGSLSIHLLMGRYMSSF